MNKTNLHENKGFYKHNASKDHTEQTQERLKEIEALGMEEIGIASFGIKGKHSGLYLEMIWNYSEEEWLHYINWVKTL